MRRSLVLASLAFASAALHGCAVGPNYKRPSAPTPPAFKEDAPPGQRPEDWKPAEPRDAVPRGPWWEVFGDPERIHVCPDCGLRTRSWEVAYDKLRNMVEGTKLAEQALSTAGAAT